MGSNKKNKFSKEFVENIVKDCYTIADFCRKVGWQPRGDNYKIFHKYKQEYNLDTSHFVGYNKESLAKYIDKTKTKSDEYLHENSFKITTNRLLKKLLEEGKKEHKCECCGNSEWNGKPIPIELHHINGVHNDNRIENLMVLCPNCHAQTDNYRGKSVKKEHKRYYCSNCGKEITRYSKSGMCSKCQSKLTRKVDRPTKEGLIELKTKYSMVKIGKMFGVSDNAVRKWLKYYGIQP